MFTVPEGPGGVSAVLCPPEENGVGGGFEKDRAPLLRQGCGSRAGAPCVGTGRPLANACRSFSLARRARSSSRAWRAVGEKQGQRQQ